MASRKGEAWVAVADLHGHLRPFRTLLAWLDRELGDAYRLCTLGDYVDNGEEIPELIEFLIELADTRGPRFVPVLGNHDLALLRSLGWPGSEVDERWFEHWSWRYWDPGLGTGEVYARWRRTREPETAAEFAAIFPERHRRFLEEMPWFHDTGTYVFVHAGLFPGEIEPQLRSLAAKELPPVHMWTPTHLRGPLSRRFDPGWERTVVSAHSHHLSETGRFVAPNRICLAGDVDRATGVLRAVVLPERRWVHVMRDGRVKVEVDAAREGRPA